MKLNCSKQITILFIFTLSNALFINALSQESVTMFTDRDIYMAGENIWCLTKCLDDKTKNVSTLSKVIYIEIINRNNTPIVQQKYSLLNGNAQFKITIPDTVTTDNYYLRAYTKWMQNFHQSYFATKTITIINPLSSNVFPPKNKPFNSDTLLTYPEGGKILSNSSNNILLRVLNKNGHPKQLDGLIINEYQDTICRVLTDSLGFDLIKLDMPSAAKYKLVDASNATSLTLPIALSSGVNILLKEQSNNNVSFSIAQTNTSNYESKFFLIINSKGNIVKSKKYDQKLPSEINFNNIESGIYSAILISSSGEKLSERTFIVGSMKQGDNINIITNKPTYTSRESIEIQINGKLKHTCISVIKSCLRHNPFSNPLKKYSAENYYQWLQMICGSNLSTNTLILMLKAPYIEKQPDLESAIIPELKHAIISGRVSDLRTGLPIRNKLLTLSFVGNKSTFSFSTTDSLGRFIFEANQYGKREMVIQPFKPDSSFYKNHKIELDDPFSYKYCEEKCPPLTLTIEQVNSLNDAILNMQVNRLYHDFKPNEFTTDSFATKLSFYGQPNINVIIDKYIELTSVEEIFKEIIPYVAYRKQKNEHILKVYEQPSNYPSKGQTIAFVDGVPIYDIDNILELEPEEIERIEVVNVNYFYGGIKLGRLLCIYTHSQNTGSMSFNQDIFRQAIQCYNNTFTFNGPDYSSEDQRNSRLPDFRNMLHFESFTLNKENNYTNTTSFYTSDESAEYTIIVEGVNDDGLVEQYQFPLRVTN